MDNLEELYKDETTFNEVVHEKTEAGDPQRNEDGSIRLKRDWKKVAVDRQGRTFNPKVHGKEEKLDAAGFLTVRRRDASAKQGDVSRSEALVAKHHEKGYAFYLANDDGGRLEQMLAKDWEPVQDSEGPVGMNVGQARGPNTQARLFRKPIEWYEADQEAKIERNKERFKQTTSPKVDDGQYEATPDSPLR